MFTILLGALPATYLCLLPAALIVKSIQLLAGGGIFPGSLGLLYGFAALYGAMALWLVPFTVRNPVVITGLVAGVLVISPITYAAIFKPQLYDRENWLYTLASILPFVVALTWLAYFAINKRDLASPAAADESEVNE
ncbi:MAG: hypothetical protein ACR2Q3_12055 [Woeseiaceae bacterium]